MHDRLFEAALGITPPWFVAGVGLDEPTKVLTVRIDFTAGSRFAVQGAAGDHPVHDTVTKTYRHLNFFQHECVLEVRTPRVKLPDGRVALVKPPFAGKLSGLTLLFEALVLMLAPQMPVAAVAQADLFEYIEVFYNRESPPRQAGLQLAGSVPGELDQRA